MSKNADNYGNYPTFCRFNQFNYCQNNAGEKGTHINRCYIAFFFIACNVNTHHGGASLNGCCCRCLTWLALAEKSSLPLTLFIYSAELKFNFWDDAQVRVVGAEAISRSCPLPSLCGRRLDWWGGSAQWRGPGEERDSASMAVKGERDPAVRAHIHPTSARKPAVTEATLYMGGAAARVPL